jgi:PPOX class probable F420-dependent enzyme
MPAIPEELTDLLERPLYGSLGTIRPDDTVQVNPMWYEFDGTVIRFTHTTRRAKYRNLRRNPAMSLLVADPANPQRYLEVRGTLAEVVPDPAGEFFVRLARRYGSENPQPPADRADRVILVMSVRRTAGQQPR